MFVASPTESRPEVAHPAAKCARCDRSLSAERPLRLPDNRIYCAACCESMAADDFEMETGETFTRWIEKHPQLVMQYQPSEQNIRLAIFIFTAVLAFSGFTVLVIGIVARLRLFQLLEPLHTWRGLVYVAIGLIMSGVFGIMALHSGRNYLRTSNFKLTLKDGTFYLQHGAHSDTFAADDVTQACVVRPGTVGATEGALRLQDGRMLTLDTCLSDLHALGVVMDLRFRNDFPPSADDIAKVRRDKLRKIRGLS